MIDVNYFTPSLIIPRHEIDLLYEAASPAKYKNILKQADIPKECKTTLEIFNTGMILDPIVFLEYTADMLTEDMEKYFKINNTDYVTSPHVDGSTVNDRYMITPASYLYPYKNCKGTKIYWYDEIKKPEVFTVSTGTTWASNPNDLVKDDEITINDDMPVILRTDKWHSIEFSKINRVTMRLLFDPLLTWQKVKVIMSTE